MGLVPRHVRDLHEGIEREAEAVGLASCQYAIGMEGEVVAAATIGDAPADARYLLFSSTKAITAALIWQLLEDGTLLRHQPITTWWPEFGQKGKETITVEHLLTHQGGLPTPSLLDAHLLNDRAARVAQMEQLTPEWDPGSRSQYHPLAGHWILAELIARVTGQDHRDAIRKRVLDPLGLDRLEVGVSPERQAAIQPLRVTGEGPSEDEVAAVFGRDAARELMPLLELGVEPDENVQALASPVGLTAGVPGAGGVSDAASMALLYQELLHNRAGLWDEALLREATGTIICFDPGTVGNAAMRGLGIDISGDGTAEERRNRVGSGQTSTTAFGHGGAGGQIAWADPTTGMSFAFLTNGWDLNPFRGRDRDLRINALAVHCFT